MKRTPMPPRAQPIRRGPIKKRSRSKAEATRVYGPPRRRAWIASQACCIPGQHEGVTQNVHVVGGGMGRKADAALVVPMCAAHHRLLHTWGAGTFQRMTRVELLLVAADTERRWQEYEMARQTHFSERKADV